MKEIVMNRYKTEGRDVSVVNCVGWIKINFQVNFRDFIEPIVTNITDIIGTFTTEFKKSGFSDEDAAMLAETASMLQNVADEELTAGEAANFLISQMTAFHLEAEDANHVLDALNEVSNNFAVSSGQLTTSLPLVSAALSVGNNKFEEMIGLVTGAVEVTRNASKASRGLVSIQSRLNQVVDETSSTGQKLTQWYQEHNIAIYDQEGQLRSLYDILSDVSKQWGTLSTNEKDYYLNQQAGELLRPFSVNCWKTLRAKQTTT